MEAVINAFREDDEHDENWLHRLREARGNAGDFSRLAWQFGRRIGSTYLITRATWLWPGGSVADTLLTGHRPDLEPWSGLPLWCTLTPPAARAASRRSLLLSCRQRSAC